MSGYTMTQHRVITRRAVIWLGQTCNLRCYFCYFLDKINTRSHPEHAMMPLDKAKSMCKTLVEFYGCNSIDIQGGEPLVWKDIYELISYCSEIGLKPTLITNGIKLANMDVCKKLKESGVYDLLFSIHGIGETYDEIVGMHGGSDRQLRAIDNLREVGIPFRFNCVLSKPVVSQLPQLAEITFSSGARAMNFIAFNPFVDQTSGKRSTETVAGYSEVMQVLTPILDEFDRRGVECNVRYFPFCVFEERHRKFCQNFQQIVYDLHEWDAASEYWTSLANQRQAALPLSAPVALDESIWIRRFQWLDRVLVRWGKIYPVTRPILHFARSIWRSSRHTLCQRKANKIQSGGGSSCSADPSHAVTPLFQVPPEYFHPLLSPLGRRIEALCKFARENLIGDIRLSKEEYLNRQARRLMPLAAHSFLKCDSCKLCDLSPICDGFHGDYGDLFTFSEARSIKLGKQINDPKHYIQHQMKVVEEQEYYWALNKENQ